MGDAGLTGRKIIVDTYGGYSRHGGGALSGKDATKVDRSACYMARYVAKNIVAAGLATKVEVQLAYAIGVAEPVSLLVHTFGTGKIAEDRLAEIVRANFDCRPGALVRELNLLRPIYQKTAAYGHFGRNEPEFTWEKTNKADALKSAAKKYFAVGAANGAAKAGAAHFMRHLSQEVAADGVTANVISLGFMNTMSGPFAEKILPSVPAGRFGTPEDLGAAAVYLASTEAAWVTGATLVVDGGYTPF